MMVCPIVDPCTSRHVKRSYYFRIYYRDETLTLSDHPSFGMCKWYPLVARASSIGWFLLKRGDPLGEVGAREERDYLGESSILSSWLLNTLLPSVKVEKQKKNNKYHFHSRENLGLISIKIKF